MIVPVVLSGGSGTRLWPLSTAARPKQFLPLVGNESLFSQTLARVSDRKSYAAPIVVANVAHMDLCLDELADCHGATLILEPCARNTAAAIIMAAEVVVQSHGPDAMMLVMPSDHRIGDPEAFHAAIQLGASAAATGRLVTFGVVPDGPQSGYGYLKAGEQIAGVAGAYDVEKFIEKPELAVAEAMIAAGGNYWNGGIFLFRAGEFQREAAKHASDVQQCAALAIGEAEMQGQCILPSLSALEPCPDISVDYAIMERSGSIAMIPLDADWSDVGSWDALAELNTRNQPQALVTSVKSENCYVRSDSLKVGLLGVRDLVVVATGDQVLIMQKGQSQHIRQLVAQALAEE